MPGGTVNRRRSTGERSLWEEEKLSKRARSGIVGAKEYRILRNKRRDITRNRDFDTRGADGARAGDNQREKLSEGAICSCVELYNNGKVGPLQKYRETSSHSSSGSLRRELWARVSGSCYSKGVRVWGERSIGRRGRVRRIRVVEPPLCEWVPFV